MEEHQTNVDMEMYFMERVRLQKHGRSNLLSLEVSLCLLVLKFKGCHFPVEAEVNYTFYVTVYLNFNGQPRVYDRIISDFVLLSWFSEIHSSVSIHG